MQCSICGGTVVWVGPLVNLTHTECRRCGAMNSQYADEHYPNEEPEEEYCECHCSDVEEEGCSGVCGACGGIL